MNQSLIFLYQGNKIYFQLYHTVLQTMYPYIYIYIYIYIIIYLYMQIRTRSQKLSLSVSIHALPFGVAISGKKGEESVCVCGWMKRVYIFENYSTNVFPVQLRDTLRHLNASLERDWRANVFEQTLSSRVDQSNGGKQRASTTLSLFFFRSV